MRSAAAVAAERGADLIDLNMGCPVPKVMKTGAGAALISDPDTAVAVALAAREGSGLPVTVKLRAAIKPGGVEGFEVARRLVEDAGVAGLTFHPRSAAVRHKGTPDYELATRLVDELPVPMIVSGGMEGAEHIRAVFESTGCAAVMLARGALGNPWLFAQVLGTRGDEPIARGGARRVALGARPRRRAPRAGPRRPLPAQVPSLVRRAAGRGQGGPGRAAAGGHDRRAARRDRRACSPFWRPEHRCYHAPPFGPPCSGPCVFQDPTSQGRRMQKDVILTPEGLEKLKQEIEHLSVTRRREVAERIKEAREFGDISENSEYDDAKNEQAMLEQRIAQLEDKLRSAQVINASELDNNVVRVGSLVSGKDEKGKALRVRDRRLDRGRPGEQAALERVARRQGADRPQEGRHGLRARPQGRAQAHHRQDQRRRSWRRAVGTAMTDHRAVTRPQARQRESSHRS